MKTTEIKIEVGDFIEIPAWKTFGFVAGVCPSKVRTDTIDVTLQEDPERPNRLKVYRLRNGEFRCF